MVYALLHTMLCVCSQSKKTPIIDNVVLTNMFPYRDRLSSLGIVVLVLWSVICYRGWSVTWVQLLQTQARVSIFQEI